MSPDNRPSDTPENPDDIARRRRRVATVIALLLLLLLLGWGWREQTRKAPPKAAVVQQTSVPSKRAPTRRKVPNCRPSGAEVCDGLDNDCDGQIDEGYELACQACGGARAGKSGCIEAKLVGGGWFAGKARNLLLGNDHGIALPAHPKKSPYIYIANSGEGTVSKLRISDGVEIGRFFVGHNPSRTAVDSDGNAWVAMRGGTNDRGKGKVQENVVKIEGACTPKIKPPQTTRECIALDIPEVGNLLRGIAVDATGDVWVGSYAMSEVIRLDGRTGLVRKRISLGSRVGAYGLAVDERGFVWVASRAGKLAVQRIDPLTNKVDLEVPKRQVRYTFPYGIAADGAGGIWFGTAGPYVFQVDAVTGKVKQFVSVGKQTRGVAIDVRGWLWVADARAGTVIKVSRKDGTVSGTYPVGKSPVGVGVDHDGAIWAVNLRSNDATKMSVDGQVLGTYPVGKSPYTYSDMTGTAYRVFQTLRGLFRGKYRTGLPGAKWKELVWEGVLSQKATMTIRARAADSPKALAKAPWTALVFKGKKAPLSLRGAIVELEVAMKTSQRTSPSFLDSLVLQLHK